MTTKTTKSPGIDYGMGTTNIDHANGIRYGVIPANDLAAEAWYETAEADYGPPTCPKCGNEAIDLDTDSPTTRKIPELPLSRQAKTAGWEAARQHMHSAELACRSCRYLFDGEEAYPDEPHGYYLDDGEYKAQQSDTDVFVTKSPYYTFAPFCSPCAPGACYLRDGEHSQAFPKAYCFGPDWFDEDNPCPYPVWEVETGKQVYEPKDE